MAITGQGVRGEIDGRHVAVGNARLLDAEGAASEALATKAEALRRDGQTVMFVSIDQRAAGLLGVADPIKPSTQEAIGLPNAALCAYLAHLNASFRATWERIPVPKALSSCSLRIIPAPRHQRRTAGTRIA